MFSAPTQTKFEYLLFFKVHQIKIAQICLLPCLTRPANTHKCTRKSGNFLESQAILLQNPHQSTLLLFLVVLGSCILSFLPLLFFAAWLSLPSFFFFSCWFWFGVLLSVVVPIFCSTWTFLLCFSFWCVWWTNSVEAWYFFGGRYWSYYCQKGVFPAERTGKKNESNNGTQGFAQLRVRCARKI